MSLTGADIIASQLPFCHIAITTTLIPAALLGTLDFPAQLSGARTAFYPMLAYWLLSLVTVGRGWCSWVCFYGGIEDGLSALPRSARLDLRGKGASMRRFNFAVLGFVALAGLGSLAPVYCEWLCPFKLVTEYSDPSDLRIVPGPHRLRRPLPRPRGGPAPPLEEADAMLHPVPVRSHAVPPRPDLSLPRRHRLGRLHILRSLRTRRAR